MQPPKLDPYQPAKPPGSVVSVRAVVIEKDRVEAAITKKCAAEFSDGRRCFHPTRGGRIECSEGLQLSILLLRQKLNAHSRRRLDRAVFWLVFFPRIQRFAVVAKTSAAFRALLRAVIEDAFACSFACTLVHSIPLWRFMFFSKRAFNALSISSRCLFETDACAIGLCC